MAKPITIPNTFASATSAIPLSQLDQDFSTLANATNDLATYSNYVADTGAADAYIANFPANTNTSSLTAGLTVQFKAANSNTGASTLNVQVNGASIGTAAIRYANGSSLAAGAIASGALVSVMYDGTNFQLINDPAGQSGGDVTGPASATDNAIARFDGASGKLIQNSVVTIDDTTGNMAGVGTLSSGAITSSSLTSGRVLYAGTSGLIQDSANLTFNGTTFTSVNDISVNGLTVGEGGGAVSTNTAVGASALVVNTTGANNTALGSSALVANITGNHNTAVGTNALAANTTNGITAVGSGALQSNTTGSSNTAVGRLALNLNTTGINNIAVGTSALTANTTGNANTSIGATALAANTTGSSNTGVGYESLRLNTTGANNTALGQSALYSNTTASNNTAVGYQAGYSNTTGTQNSSFGSRSFEANTTGSNNVALGYASLFQNTTGSNNVAVGWTALYSNTTASRNTAVGYQAGYSNTTGQYNTFIGTQSGYTNSTGNFNTVVGDQAGYNLTTGQYNTIIGTSAGYALTTGTGNTFVGPTGPLASGERVTTGSKHTIIGAYSGNNGGLDIRTASNYIVLSDGDGNPRIYNNGANSSDWNFVSSNSNLTISAKQTTSSFEFQSNANDGYLNLPGTGNILFRYGAGYTLRFQFLSSGAAYNSTGTWGTISDAKVKENIVDATPKLDKIKQLKVRNYNLIGEELKQIGFVAQEFEQVFPSMVEETVDKDKDGNELGTTTKAIKTSILVPILVKAVQELTAKVEALEAQLNNK